MKKRPIVYTLAALFTASPLSALAGEIISYDNGSYRHDGLHSGGNTNNFTGGSLGGGNFPAFNTYRGFFAFDLAGASTASAISVTFFARGTLRTYTGSETVKSYDYGGSVDGLVAGSTVSNSAGDASYADLGSGELLGEYTLTGANSSAMPEITVLFSSAFVEQFNLALQGSQKIAFGADFTTGVTWTDQGFWAGANGIGSARLNITEVAAEAVPEPSSLVLAAAGLLGLIRSRRRPS